MFKWLKKTTQTAFINIQDREMRDWIGQLRSQDSNEVAAILVMAMHFRNTLLRNGGVDLMFPHLALSTDPMLAVRLNQQLQELQREKLFTVASGAIVWLFTVRAAIEPALRDLGRQLWGQLERGFPKADEAVDGLFRITGLMADITDIGRFPDGFTPNPL